MPDEPGTKIRPLEANAPWAEALRSQLQETISSPSTPVEQLTGLIQVFQERQAYRQLTDSLGYYFRTFDRFCSDPQPFGLGCRLGRIEKLIAARRSKQEKDT
jgi:hypothetical protein